MVYGLGHKVRRNGQLNLMEAIRFPLDASPTNTGLTPPPTTNQYPSVIIPTDKVHIKLGECLNSCSNGRGALFSLKLKWMLFRLQECLPLLVLYWCYTHCLWSFL